MLNVIGRKRDEIGIVQSWRCYSIVIHGLNVRISVHDFSKYLSILNKF